MSGSYLVLARKYRPKTFDEVVGQDVAKRVLRGAIADGRLGHAYLLSGPRGTGKTTLARIVARSLNCEEGPTPDPCGVCERCTGLDQGREADVIEIDAASNTGVDSIRDLRDEVAYSPMRARKKVYIIDEVHMLSKAAFNALLKTLEEPPPHVVFLFATTEPHKVLDTILSRCQVLRLEPITVPLITARLDQVFGFEGIEAEAGITEEIARGSRGGMRDALSKADELLALGGTKPTLADLEALGAGGGAVQVAALLDALEDGDKPGVLTHLADLPGTPAERLGRLLAELRRSVLVGHLGVSAPQVEGTVEEKEAAMARAKRLGLRRMELMMQELLRARERARLLPGEEDVVLEVCLLELSDPDNTVPVSELVARLEQLSGGAPLAPMAQAASPRVVPTAPIPQVPRGKAARAQAATKSAPTTLSPKSASPSHVQAGRVQASGSQAPQPQARATTAAPPTNVAARPVDGGPREWLKAAVGLLKDSHGSLANLLDVNAQFQVTNGTGQLTLTGLSETATRLANDKRNQRRLATTLVQTSGAATVVIEIGGAAPIQKVRSSGPPSSAAGSGSDNTQNNAGGPSSTSESDPLTKDVADLFEGMIEDLGPAKS